MVMKSLLRKLPGFKSIHLLWLTSQHSIKSSLFEITKILCLVFKPQISLAYDNEGKTDGIGAQIQRILAIRSLSHNLHLEYFHSGIKSVAVHPLDPFQTPEALHSFLLRLNDVFLIKHSPHLDEIPDQIVKVKVLTFPILLKYISVSLIKRKSIRIVAVEPYSISEFDKNKFKDITDFLPNYPRRPRGKKRVSIHYRRGVGGFAVQNGESISREIEATYFRELLKEIVRPLDKSNIEIVVFTDSPAIDLAYVPPKDQHQLWENSPRFDSGVMSVKGLNLEEQFLDLGFPVSIIYGGDPLDVLIEMSFSDHLVMSRSSFSYVASLLNKTGRIYFPKTFWHGALPNWIAISEPKHV
jgi:hypothetical protein